MVADGVGGFMGGLLAQGRCATVSGNSAVRRTRLAEVHKMK